jgi:cytochrome c-type biogenesis protein CcmH
MIRMFRSLALAAIVALAAPFAAQAVQPDEVLPDQKLEQRAREISTGLRCMVCQNQSIDDSDAPLAKDLRVLVRDRLKAGDSDDQVRAYLQARYGDFVLLKPPFQLDTLVLWITPAVVLVLAFGFAFSRVRGQKPAPVAGLSEEEKAALERLSAGDDAAQNRLTKA